MGDMTSTTMATWVPAVWSDIPTITYRSNVVLVPMLDHTWEPEIGVGQGDRVNIPGFSQNNAASNRGAGSGTFGTGASTTFDSVTEAQTQLVVNRFYYKAFRQPVEAKAQAMPSYLTRLLDGQAKALALQVDADIAGDNTDGIDSFSTTVGTDNVDVTEDNLLTVETNLNGQNAPATDRFLVVSPATRGSLFKIEAVRNSLYATSVGNLDGSQGLGYLGKFLSFDVYMSNNLEAGSSGKKNGGFHREALAYAEQLKVQTEHTFNIQDGAFHQYITFMTAGLKKVKGTFGNELDGK